jgi:hypothetical protein
MNAPIANPDAMAAFSAAHGSAFPRALPGMEAESVRLDDIILTPLDVARDVVKHFKPSGRILDPCRGNGAFADLMPGCDWCEIREGRDFYDWREPVDWIVSNPPYSVFADFLRHSLTVAENIVYLIPVNKIFNSDRMMREIWTWGGVPEIYTVAGGGALGFPIGFAIGAVHFRRAYRGETRVTFRTPNTQAHR